MTSARERAEAGDREGGQEDVRPSSVCLAPPGGRRGGGGGLGSVVVGARRRALAASQEQGRHARHGIERERQVIAGLIPPAPTPARS